MFLDDIVALHDVSKGKVVELRNTKQTDSESIFASGLKRQKIDSNASLSSAVERVSTVWGFVLFVRVQTVDIPAFFITYSFWLKVKVPSCLA